MGSVSVREGGGKVFKMSRRVINWKVAGKN